FLLFDDLEESNALINKDSNMLLCHARKKPVQSMSIERGIFLKPKACELNLQANTAQKCMRLTFFLAFLTNLIYPEFLYKPSLYCSLIEGNHKHILQALFITITLGFYFTLLQASEYYKTPFTISDGIYGSTFFITTDFHGLHPRYSYLLPSDFLNETSTQKKRSPYKCRFDPIGIYPPTIPPLSNPNKQRRKNTCHSPISNFATSNQPGLRMNSRELRHNTNHPTSICSLKSSSRISFISNQTERLNAGLYFLVYTLIVSLPLLVASTYLKNTTGSLNFLLLQTHRISFPYAFPMGNNHNYLYLPTSNRPKITHCLFLSQPHGTLYHSYPYSNPLKLYRGYCPNNCSWPHEVYKPRPSPYHQSNWRAVHSHINFLMIKPHYHPNRNKYCNYSPLLLIYTNTTQCGKHTHHINIIHPFTREHALIALHIIPLLLLSLNLKIILGPLYCRYSLKRTLDCESSHEDPTLSRKQLQEVELNLSAPLKKAEKERQRRDSNYMCKANNMSGLICSHTVMVNVGLCEDKQKRFSPLEYCYGDVPKEIKTTIAMIDILMNSPICTIIKLCRFQELYVEELH
ncbi:hypothetical protein EI555_012069, partial [Monodon monoceros]